MFPCACVCAHVCVCVHYMYLPARVIGTIVVVEVIEPLVIGTIVVVEVIDPRDVSLFEDSIVGQIEGLTSSNFMELSTITILNINYMSLMILYHSTWYSTGVKWSHCIVIYRSIFFCISKIIHRYDSKTFRIVTMTTTS